MAVDLEKYGRLKKRAEQLKSDYSKAEGILEEQMRKLKDDFGVDTLEAAEAMIIELESAQKEAEDKYNSAFAEYEEKWGKV